MEKIHNLLEKLNISKDNYQFYGQDIAKVNASAYGSNKRKAKLILMTSINPTPSGEGKTTTAIGLTDGLNYNGENAIFALREPSLGPVFGRKGTATGGGESEVIPMDKINLHFTGDFHAITTANNIISAALDSVIYWKNELNIDPNRVVWKRCMDLNDRALREIEVKISKTISRKEEFTITAASNMMTILTIAKDEDDLRNRIENALVAYTKDGKEVYAKQLEVVGSVMAILSDAMKPNFVTTKYDSPVFVHCGPFANIATGTNSVISTDLSMKLSDYTIVESGFGSDLGFEKFMNVMNWENDLVPSCVVMVVTLRALNLHDDFNNNFKHLEQHLKHVTVLGLNLVVAINFISGDSEEQLETLRVWLQSNGYEWAMNEAYIQGASGASDLAKKVVEVSNKEFTYNPLFAKDALLSERLSKLSEKWYYTDYEIAPEAQKQLEAIEAHPEWSKWPVCVVKSFTTIDGNDNNEDNYKLRFSSFLPNTGARFVLAYTNKVMPMPGLNKKANYQDIDLIDGEVVGLK